MTALPILCCCWPVRAHTHTHSSRRMPSVFQVQPVFLAWHSRSILTSFLFFVLFFCSNHFLKKMIRFVLCMPRYTLRSRQLTACNPSSLRVLTCRVYLPLIWKQSVWETCAHSYGHLSCLLVLCCATFLSACSHIPFMCRCSWKHHLNFFSDDSMFTCSPCLCSTVAQTPAFSFVCTLCSTADPYILCNTWHDHLWEHVAK